MFVLKNCWAQLGRHKWRTLLMFIVALLVTVWSVYGTAVLHADSSANGEEYDAIAPVSVIRPTAAKMADRAGDDSSWTKNYLSWDDYNSIYGKVSSSVEAGYSIAESVPVRQSDSVKAITTSATSDASEDKTGGDLTLQSFYTAEATEANEYGTYDIVAGNELDYTSTSDTNVLISQELADKNDIHVGDEITLGNPTDAKTTYKLKVGGIYKYTSNPYDAEGNNAKFAKDNRNNVIYTTYYTFATQGLDTDEGDGWGIPDLNIVFTLTSPSKYDEFAAALKKAKAIPDGFQISSPTLEKYKASLTGLDALATQMRIMTICLWSVGGLLLLAFTLWGSLPRRDEIGNALLLGVSKARLGWQFMLEVFFPVLVGFGIGLLVGGLTTKSVATKMAGGHTVELTSQIMWNTVWIGLAFTLALAVIAMLRVAFFSKRELFVSPYHPDPLADEKKDEIAGSAASSEPEGAARGAGDTETEKE